MSHANLVLLILIGVLCSTIIADLSISCRNTKVWADCTKLCRKFCRSRFIEACYEGEECLHGCECVEGYVMFSTRDCIRASECGKMRRQDLLTRANMTFIDD